MAICDGCGATADAEHVRRRIERLELATRYRPVHIQTLLIGAAPPERAEEYVYCSEREGAELQRNGIFVVYAAECPLAGGAEESGTVKRLAATMVKRVGLSYKPKSIVLFGAATAELMEPLRAAGWADKLILKDGAPFAELPGIERLAAGN